MTKQQLLALLREAYCLGVSDAYDELRGSGNTTVESSFIAEIERTNRVGDLGLPDINKLKADAVREASRSCGRYLKASALNGLYEYADKLEKGEL